MSMNDDQTTEGKGSYAIPYHSQLIFWRYLKTWLVLDMLLVSLDVLNIASDYAGVAVIRFARVVRIFRLLRLLKMTKLDEITQEIAASTGRQWIMLVMAVCNSAIVTMLVAHIVTCFWFWVGTSASRQDV
ncbi:eag [Symbiodinium natans]|uniref:Eag protein n=1 Tax=Symbiodinium natans TaxID=878477 RepID=A0A812UCZ8_9DINO|nr:eag [Symbiodinium natans]